MAYTPQELLKQHLEQLNDYLKQLKDDAYNRNEESFQRKYNEIKSYLKVDSRLAGLPQIKHIHYMFANFLEEARKINQFEIEKEKLRSQSKKKRQVLSEPLGWSDYRALRKQIEGKIDGIDVDNTKIAAQDEQPANESSLGRNIARHQSVVTSKTSFKDKVVEQESVQVNTNVSSKNRKKIKSSKSYTQLWEEQIKKEKLKEKLKALESAIKHYKEFAQADLKYKEKYQGQDVQSGLSFYANAMQEIKGLNDELKKLPFSLKEQKQLAERIKIANNDRLAMLAHHEYSQIKKHAWIDAFGSYDNLQHTYSIGEHYPEYIQMMTEALSQINNLIKNHAIVKSNHPELLGKYHEKLIKRADADRADLRKYLHIFKENKEQYKLAVELKNQVALIKEKLQPADHPKSNLAARYIEKNKKLLLDKLNKLKTPEQVFDDKNRVAGLKELKQAIAGIESQLKNNEIFYKNVEQLYLDADVYRKKYHAGRNSAERKISKELALEHRAFLKEFFEKQMIVIYDARNFADPNMPVNIGSIYKNAELLLARVEEIDLFFANASSALATLSKGEHQIGDRMMQAARLGELQDVGEQLMDNCLRANQEVKRLILKSMSDKNHLVDSFSNLPPRQCNNYYVSEWKSALAEHHAEVRKAIGALNMAKKSFDWLNHYQAMLPEAKGKYHDIVLAARDQIKSKKENIINILSKRPLSEMPAHDINLVMQNNKYDMQVFGDIKWLAEDGEKRVNQLIAIVANEISMLQAGVMLLSDANINGENDDGIKKIKAEIIKYQAKLERLELFKEEPLHNIADARFMRNNIQVLEKSLTEDVLYNAARRIQAYVRMADTGVLTSFELADLKHYLNMGKPDDAHGGLTLDDDYADLFKRNNSPLSEQFNQLIEKVNSGKLYFVEKQMIKKVLADEVTAPKNVESYTHAANKEMRKILKGSDISVGKHIDKLVSIIEQEMRMLTSHVRKNHLPEGKSPSYRNAIKEDIASYKQMQKELNDIKQQINQLATTPEKNLTQIAKLKNQIEELEQKLAEKIFMSAMATALNVSERLDQKQLSRSYLVNEFAPYFEFQARNAEMPYLKEMYLNLFKNSKSEVVRLNFDDYKKIFNDISKVVISEKLLTADVSAPEKNSYKREALFKSKDVRSKTSVDVPTVDPNFTNKAK